jgi:hypothetical protein
METIQNIITPNKIAEHINGLGFQLEQEQPQGATPANYEHVYFPNINNKPPEQQPIVTLGGTQVLTHQNVSTIIAAQGMGKTSLQEGVVSAFLNPDCDSLGFGVSTQCKGIISADMERTQIDVWNTFHRIKKRAQLPDTAETLPNVILAGLRAIPRVNERKEIIEYMINNNPCTLLILDGSGDLVNDVNSLDEAIECRVWLRELTVKYGVSILSTLHPNPGSTKPRGHQGSEHIRECEAVLLARKYEGDVRILTSDFEHGKNRNGAPVTVGYRWDDDSRMFIGCDIDGMAEKRAAAKEERKLNELKDLFKKIVPPTGGVRRNDLEERISEELEKSLDTGRRRVNEALKNGIISKGDDDYYRIII